MATRAPKSMVKNKAPAPVQITAEQLMREAMERVEAEPKKPRQKITNHEELAEYRMRKRKDFEDALRRQRHSISTWLRYASWEATQKEFDRARSVFERALEVEYQNTGIWLKYAETEMKNKFVNHARNVWDRAVSLLPRVDQFWLKFAYMEEMLGNIDGARVVFERWMQWQPDSAAWNSYVKFELRQGDIERARAIFERFLVVHNEVATYMKYAKFEEKHGKKENARVVFERATVELGDDITEDLIIAFAQFEERCKEFERAGLIYRHALDNLPKHKAKEVYQQYIQFEKQHGSKDGVENVILSKRRFQYEEELKDNPHNYDVWFDYIRLEEAAGDMEKIREIYERAVGNVPPLQEKRYWKRYIYLWINYALYEEMVAKDFERTRAVYAECIKLVPHQHFTFAKIWVLAAHFEVRRKDIDAARRILGTAIGKAPKEKIFKAYIDLEASLSEVDRCRILYQKYVEFMPTNCHAWTKFAEFEKSLEEFDRVRSIFELAVQQRLLDMPEVVWKAYIDFEISQNQTGNVRNLYSRLIRMSTSAKPWISSAQFEASISEFDRARNIFSEANQVFKERETKEDRVLILEAWRDFESIYGSKATLADVAKKMPKRVKKKKLIKGDDGAEAGWEEYYDFIFPDEEAKTSTLAILEAARKWKKQKSVAEQQQEARENEQAAAAAEVAEAAGVADMDADEDM